MNLSELIEQAEREGADFKKVLIPNSTYRCKVTHAKYNPSKKGNPGFGIRTEVLEGPYAGKGFWSNFYLTPVKKDGTPNNTGVAIFFRQVAALGVSTDEFKAGLTVEAAVDRFVGQVLDVETEENEYPVGSGDKSTRAKNIKPVSGTAVPSVTPPAAPVAAPPSGLPF